MARIGCQMVLTEAGLENIANYKYNASKNSLFDDLLNPLHNKLVNLLPLVHYLNLYINI